MAAMGLSPIKGRQADATFPVQHILHHLRICPIARPKKSSRQKDRLGRKEVEREDGEKAAVWITNMGRVKKVTSDQSNNINQKDLFLITWKRSYYLFMGGWQRRSGRRGMIFLLRI